MKKILTIAATGVICVLAAATQTLAQATSGNVTSGGTAASTCAIASTTDGKLALNAGGDALSTDVEGGNKGSVVVKCAQGSSLKLGVPALTAPNGANATNTVSNFNGGSGAVNFTTATGQTIQPIATKKTGATANVSTTVTALNDEFITPGVYKVVVPATLTP
jgi:hypothetical protein